VIGFGRYSWETSFGSPEIVKLTGELNAPMDLTVTVAFEQLVMFTISKLGDAVRMKSGVARLTTS